MTKRISKQTTPPPAVSITEACRLLGISERSVYKAMNAGKLKTKKYGHRTLVLRSEIDRFLNELPDRP
jgi:excisionase family DNA binding protein